MKTRIILIFFLIVFIRRGNSPNPVITVALGSIVTAAPPPILTAAPYKNADCRNGSLEEQMEPTEAEYSDSSADAKSFKDASGDPSEIIDTKGYDALGNAQQWRTTTASLPYTIYFENDPELATAAAQKVEIRHAYYSIMN